MFRCNLPSIIVAVLLPSLAEDTQHFNLLSLLHDGGAHLETQRLHALHCYIEHGETKATPLPAVLLLLFSLSLFFSLIYNLPLPSACTACSGRNPENYPPCSSALWLSLTVDCLAKSSPSLAKALQNRHSPSHDRHHGPSRDRNDCSRNLVSSIANSRRILKAVRTFARQAGAWLG